MNIFTMCFPELYQTFIDKIVSQSVVFEHNFEQILGMARNKELKKLCIFMDVWNVYGGSLNEMRGQEAAEKIHAIDSSIPILIWEGRKYVCKNKNLPASFQLIGKLVDISNSNELYLSSDFYKGQIVIDITTKFFNGILTSKDVINRDCLQFQFMQ